MALFKIEKGTSNNLRDHRPWTNEGFCYFTTDDGKFYIDIEGDGTSSYPAATNGKRICLNAATADKVAHKLTIKINDVNASTNGLNKYVFDGSDSDTTIIFASGDGIDITTPQAGSVVFTNSGVTDIKFNGSNLSTGSVNITGAALFGSTAIGGPDIPVYWTGSAFAAITGIQGSTTITIRRWTAN